MLAERKARETGRKGRAPGTYARNSGTGRARARAEGGLAPGAPEGVASGELAGAHAGAADQTGLFVPAVDVHLSPVVVLAGRASHGLGGVLWPDRVDPVGPHTLGHED